MKESATLGANSFFQDMTPFQIDTSSKDANRNLWVNIKLFPGKRQGHLLEHGGLLVVILFMKNTIS